MTDPQDANPDRRLGHHLDLLVSAAEPKDSGRGLARVDPADMARLGARSGDCVALIGERRTLARLMPCHPRLRAQGRIQLDKTLQENAGTRLHERVRIEPVACRPAALVVLDPIGRQPAPVDLEQLGTLLNGLTVQQGDRFYIPLPEHQRACFQAVEARPDGALIIGPGTRLRIGETELSGEPARSSYADIGGLGPQLERIRELIELPLRRPELFERLGIAPPTGVLMHGPPGCGKTLIARTIAGEVRAAFFSVSGPEIIHKYYGESEKHLRRLFDEARANAPSILFLDEIDAIAPKRDRTQGDVEKRVVAQLLASMDGLTRQPGLMVIAATNLPDMLDPALRRPGRFDREIAIPIPDRHGRAEILHVHSRGMPLAGDVTLERIADSTHGFVGADLEALCREAAMHCLRRLLPASDGPRPAAIDLNALWVTMADFTAALREVEPSAIREVFAEVPDVRWSDIGGLGTVKQHLLEAVEWPLRFPELFAAGGIRPAKGILLDGPPGCGKTLLAKAVANECEANFIAIKGAELMSKYVGESERGIREVFRKARQTAPCILFFDEIDGLLPSRGGDSGDAHVGDRVLSQFLTEMDGIEELLGVLVLAATNRADRLDPALLRPGRFDEVVRIPPPDATDRLAILCVHLRAKPLAATVDAAALASRCDGYSGAELADLCNRAALAALRRAVADKGRVMLTPDDFEAALQGRSGSARSAAK